MKKQLLMWLCTLMLVLGIGKAANANLVINGGFESGDSGFITGYGDATGGGSTALWPEGVYAIGGDPQSYHPLFSNFGAQDGTHMMIVNGAPGADVTVWSQQVSVSANTTYIFSAYAASVYSTYPAVLDFSINGASMGLFTLPSQTGNWTQFYITWNSGGSATADLTIVDQNTTRGGNDFALDNIDMSDPSSPVPEPCTILLLSSGLAGLAAFRKRNQSRV